MRYRADIDGLRAFAVVPVILFHAGLPGVAGGYVGVDIFFVISGYLITSLIAGELSEGRFSLVDFYERRVRRILPAIFLVMAACIPFAFLWMLPTQRLDFFQSLVAVNVFASNVLFWAEDDYFGLASEMKPLLHTWSLAVEEQFYVAFPLILMALAALGRGRGGDWRRTAFRVTAALTVLSFVACLVAVRMAPSTAFYLTPFRAWELGIGALVAFHLLSAPGLRSAVGAGLGMALILVSIVALGKSTPFPSEWALLPVVGTALVILCAEGTAVGRWLAWRPFVWIGLLSYSAYLWHQPLFAFARIRLGEVPSEVMAGLTLLTFVLAWLSWRYVEQPIRRAPRRKLEGLGAAPFARREALFSAAGVVAAAFLALGGWGTAQNGFTAGFDRLNVAGYRWDNLALRDESWETIRSPGHERHTGDPGERTAWFEPDPNKVQILVVGNSHSKDLYNALAEYPGLSARAEIARYGVQIHNIPDRERYLWDTPNYRQADVILIASRYQTEEAQGDADLPTIPEVIARFQADGKRVGLVGHSPVFPGDEIATRADALVQDALDDGALTRPMPEVADEIDRRYWVDLANPLQEAVAEMNAELRHMADAAGVVFLDRLDYICDPDGERCDAIADDLAKHFYDGHHTTLTGAAAFGARMAQIGWLDPILDPGT